MKKRMTQRHTLTMAALLLLLAAPLVVHAQETRYRVEVIVLTHLNHAETPQEVASPRDYGDALDFLAPAEAGEDEDDMAAEPETAPEPEPADLPGATEQAVAAAAEDERVGVVPIEALGEVMQDAWRRLRLSGPFRPLVSLAWEQDSTPPFPLLRVHDDAVVMVRDPWAAIRGRLEAGEPVDAWIEAGLVPPIPPAEPPAESAADAANYAAPLPVDPVEDPTAALLERLPPPRLFYALDGTVSLVRSRFLHLYIDLQQREGIYDAAPQQPVLLPRGMRTLPAATPATEPGAVAAEPVPTAFRVFEMTQNRQVKTGQVEYFDGPVLSVLAYITAIEPETEAN